MTMHNTSSVKLDKATAKIAQELLHIKPTCIKLQPYQYVTLTTIKAEEKPNFMKLAEEVSKLFSI